MDKNEKLLKMDGASEVYDGDDNFSFKPKSTLSDSTLTTRPSTNH